MLVGHAAATSNLESFNLMRFMTQSESRMTEIGTSGSMSVGSSERASLYTGRPIRSVIGSLS